MTGSPSTPTPPAGPAADRAARLEALLGDPREPDNPHARAALLRADESGELPAATESLLGAVSLAAELVPRALGGRLDGLDGLAAVLRPLGRRHFGLGWTRGVAPFAAAAAVWADGTEAQRAATAQLLLGGGRIASLARVPATGAAAVRGGLRARPAAGGFVLSGHGPAVPEADRAEALLAYARTGGSASPRSHSALLLDVRRLPAERLRRGPRTAAPHGRFARVELDACPVPRSQLVGEVGRCAALPGVGTAAPALPEARLLADRYAWLLAAAACVAVRQEHAGRSWPGEPAWAVVALGRIGRRLALDVPPPGARTVEAVVAELLRRHRRFRSFDLYGLRLAGEGAAYGRR
ncbi:acyl-CoA dehydrogenase family protein [Streptomyces sp. CMB-StM0423]|uniref:acyl-CoA dehydrogenase family protein n=1 Tax=Streptomyces sp. CMB-StM0423 TaxID=2059884 RepID=UPI000C708E4B|nr:acyl-CoA dehydrogenase family protein [Streptomyces sp. CMB-StM0423]AUH39576.1 hypothetical protein CXR04_04300 [Streptomyces sp. CMB-StM0423]